MLSQSERRILVLGDDTNVLLAILRSLGRHSLTVESGWCRPDAPACRSRYLARRHELPSPAPGDERWVEALAGLLRAERFDLVLPASEAAAYALHTHRKALDGCGRIYCLNDWAFSVAYDKARTYEVARTVGIPIPATIVVRDPADVAGIVNDLRPPWVVKTACSVRRSDWGQKNFVRRASTPQGLETAVWELLAHDPRVVVQEAVPGVGVGVEVLAERGKILLAFQHRRLHETAGSGSTYRVSEPLDSRLVADATRLLAALDYTGVGMIEFRMDLPSRRYVLLELNGRFWGSLPLAVAAGAHFPYHLCRLLLDGQRPEDTAYRVGIRARSLFPDLRWFWRAWRRPAARDGAEATTWMIDRKNRRDLLRELGRLILARDTIDSFAMDDPVPAMFDLLHIARILPAWALKRLSPSSAPKPATPSVAG